MLEPDLRHLVTDALRPPAGYSVDAAIATTYSLDLNTLLMAPLAMAAYDQSDNEDVNTLALLESVRRHAGRTTVFCQAGAIHVPGSYPRLAAFAEDCVVEVDRPAPGRVFHPKLWALRFIDDEGSQAHRMVCLSRNLTADRSWDTILVCDEDPDAANHFDADPLAAFLTDVAASATMSPERRAVVEDLLRTLSRCRLAVPPPFTYAELLPLGTRAGGSWPLPDRVRRQVVVSPFLDVGAVRRLPASHDRVIVSRPETFELLGQRNLAEFSTMVLQQSAEGLADDEVSAEPSDIATSPSEVSRGLHAKVFAWDADGKGHLLTGSANCTGAAFGGNIEFSVHMWGPESQCGAAAIMSEQPGQEGFIRLLQPYTVLSTDGSEDPRYALERQIEEFHALLARSEPRLVVEHREDRFDLTLAMTLPDQVGTSVVRPVALKSAAHAARLSQPLPTWRDVGLTALSPYLVVETTLVEGALTVARSCVIRAEVVGAPPDRSNRILRELLDREDKILRFLALLLGDPGLDDLLDRLLKDAEDEEEEDPEKRKRGAGRPAFQDLVLLEPLVRAAARSDSSLRRAQETLEALRDDEGNLPHVGSDFQQLWDVVWEARSIR